MSVLVGVGYSSRILPHSGPYPTLPDLYPTSSGRIPYSLDRKDVEILEQLEIQVLRPEPSGASLMPKPPGRIFTA